MKLWMIIEKRVYEETIVKTGEYVCNKNKSEMLLNDSYYHTIDKAYKWLGEEMKRRIESNEIEYPVWAWYRLRGKEKRPDLRWTEFKGNKEPMVLLEIEIEDKKVLLSDEEKWTCAQLNNAPWCDTDEELDWYYDNESVSEEEKEEFKKKSWNRIFDVKESQNVQATFWKLKKENVKRVWYFNEK